MCNLTVPFQLEVGDGVHPRPHRFLPLVLTLLRFHLRKFSTNTVSIRRHICIIQIISLNLNTKMIELDFSISSDCYDNAKGKSFSTSTKTRTVRSDFPRV